MRSRLSLLYCVTCAYVQLMPVRRQYYHHCVHAGGSAVASDTIYREILKVKTAGKPVVVSMGNVAASGGYYISAPATKIVAQPSTVTGSIGVVSPPVPSQRFASLAQYENNTLWKPDNSCNLFARKTVMTVSDLRGRSLGNSTSRTLYGSTASTHALSLRGGMQMHSSPFQTGIQSSCNRSITWWTIYTVASYRRCTNPHSATQNIRSLCTLH